MTVTLREDREAARRLKLPDPSRWSVNDAQEARTCIGCTATYRHNIRVVAMIPACPAHKGGRYK